MFKEGEKIYSSKTGRTYTITWASEKVTQAEVGFAEANGKEYFLKRHLGIKYPTDDAPLSPATKKSVREKCETEYKRKSEVYETIRKGCGEGGACVPILDYFREGTFYYTAYSKIDATSLTITQISELPKKEKYTLLLRIIQGLMPLHTLGVIHGDLKPENILVQRDEDSWRVRVIDMDDCYRMGQPKNPGEILGTIDYYSPELKTYNNYEVEDWDDPKEMAHVKSMAQELTLKSDIFALGIIFCEFYGGERPRSSDEKVSAVYEAVVKGCVELPPSVTCDSKMCSLIGKMLEHDHRSRPSINQVGEDLRKIIQNKLTAPEIKFDALDDEGQLFNCVINTYSEGYVYYTLDGSEPTITSARYTKPIQVPKFTTVSAIVTDGKHRTEAVSVQVYPKRTPSPKILVKGRSVTILPNEKSPKTTQIFYTLDESVPTKSSELYSETFYVPAGVTKIKAVAKEPDSVMSRPVETKVYNIKVTKPIIHYSFGRVSMESPQGFNIYYTFDGSIPTKDSHKYSESFDVEDTTKFHIIAVCENEGIYSDVEEIKRPSGIVMSGKK